MGKNTILTPDISYFNDERFSRREAWNWLISHPEAISIRSLALRWRWHKSKVERFIKTLKIKALIRTEIEGGKTLIIINDRRGLPGFKPSKKKPHDTTTKPKPPEDGSTSAGMAAGVKHYWAIGPIQFSGPWPIWGQNNFKKKEKEKKEKNQKKNKKEKKEEKNPLYERVKKEENFEKLVLEDVIDLIPGFSNEELSWELDKFKDYRRTKYSRGPKDCLAAFRNWLRKAIELKGARNERNEQSQKGFEGLSAAGAAEIAGSAGGRLERRFFRPEPIIFSTDPEIKAWVDSLRTAS